MLPVSCLENRARSFLNAAVIVSDYLMKKGWYVGNLAEMEEVV